MISIKALLTMEGKGSDKLARETERTRDNLDEAARLAGVLDARLGKSGSSAARRSGAFNDRDGISTKENRGAKGVAGQRGAAGRDMAGLRDASDSTSGIVAAYATAAANMFAITAAFKALADAAKVEQLRKGLELVGAQSGVSLGLVSKNIEKVTGYAISSAEAMKSVASATAAGFSSKEIERLAVVAKGASTALGRDMSDAMDRLTRGTIKLEPELLDELGIMTRIDDAVSSYADAHDKAKSSLTQTERRQAFLNAVLKEGEDKFGSIAAAVDVSPFDKLTASLKNMSTTGIGGLVKVLEPLINLLADMPQLILLPLTGIFQSVFSKLAPTAQAEFKKLENVTKQAANKFGDMRAAEFVRSQDIGLKIGDAQFVGRTKLDLNLEEGTHLSLLEKQKKILQDNLIIEQQALAVAKKQNLENSIEVKLAEQRVDNNRAALNNMNRAISETKRDQRYINPMSAAAGKLAYTDASTKAYDLTQTLFDERQGNIAGQAGALWKGAGAQLAAVNIGMKSYKANLDLANQAAGTQATLVSSLSGLWLRAGLTVKAFGTIGKLALQGFTAALPFIGWIITGFTLLTSLFEAMKSDKDRAIEASKQQLKELLESSKKVNEEVKKFRETGRYGNAFEAELTNINEIYSKLKDVEKLKNKSFNNSDKKTQEQGYLGTRSEYLAGKDIFGGAEEAQALESIFRGLESTKGVEYVKKLSISMVDAKEAGKDWFSILEPAMKGSEAIAKSWSDIGEAVKTGGQAVRKFWGDDFFKTDYSEIANTFRTITAEMKAQEQYITDPKAKLQADSDIISKFVAGGKDMFLELDRVMGENTTTFADIYKELSKKQNEINTLTAAGDKASLDRAKQLTTELNKRQQEVKKLISSSGVLAKIALEEYKMKLATINLENVKSSLTLQEIRNSANLAKNAITASKQALERMRNFQGFDNLSEGYDKADAVKQAEIELQNAKDSAKLKNDVLDREFELAGLQKELMLQKARLELSDAQAEFDKKYVITNLVNTLSMGMLSLQGAEYAVDKQRLETMTKIVGLLGDTETIGARTNAANKAANTLEVKTKEQALETTKEAYRQSLTNLKKELDIVTARLKVEQEIIALKREAFNNERELQRVKQSNAAARSASGELDIVSQLRQDADRALGSLFDKIVSETKRASEEEDKIKGLKTQQNLAAEQLAKTYTSGQGDLPTAQKNLNDATRELTTVQDLHTQKTLTAATAIALLVEAFNNLTGKLEDAGNLPMQLERGVGASKQRLAKAQASVGMNMMGAGDEFSAALDARWLATKDDVYKGDYDKFLKSDDVKLIKEASLRMAEFNLIADKTAEISVAFGEQLAGAFTSIIDGSKDAGEAFADMALSMLKMIAELIAQLIAMAAIKATAAAFGIPLADGGIMPGAQAMASGGIMNRATGSGHQGVINKPTFLVGEGKMNEAVVPLPNGRAIPVQMHGNNTSSNNVQVNVNLSQNGDARTSTQGPDMNSLGAAIAAVVQKELLAQKAPGGILSRYGAA
jgi:hypothetical protein